MKNISLILITVLALNVSGFADNARLQIANDVQATSNRHADKIKAEIQKRGIGEKSRVKVKLRDNGGEVKGYISRIDDTSFQVTDRKSGHVTSINYADVDKVRGSGLSTGAKIAIAAGVAAGVLILATILAIARD